MIVLRRCGWVDDLQVVLGRYLKQPLQPRARVLGTLPLITVRQQQHQSVEPLPFVVRAGDELVNIWLGRIPEIPVLRLPRDQSIRAIETITVLETEHSGFRKRAVINLNRRFDAREMLQRNIHTPILMIMQYRMPLAERPALRV